MYKQLADHKDEIERDLGEQVEWMELQEKKASRIKVSRSGNFEQTEKWEEYFEWMLKETEKFQRVFPRYLK